MNKLPAIMIAAVVAVLAFWGWLHFIHDPRVREAALDEIRIDSILADRDSLRARVGRRDIEISTLEALSGALRDTLDQQGTRQGDIEIVREGAETATDEALESVSRETPDSPALVRLRFTLKAERKTWQAEVRGVKAQLATALRLAQSLEAQKLLLTQNQTEVQSALDRTIVDWLDAEQRYQRARSPGFFRRLEISLPFAALGAVAGLLAGLGAR